MNRELGVRAGVEWRGSMGPGVGYGENVGIGEAAPSYGTLSKSPTLSEPCFSPL